MRVLGIDPGLRNMGWGVIEVTGAKISHVANGICHSETGDLGCRLLALHTQLTAVIATHAPDAGSMRSPKPDGTSADKGNAAAIAIAIPAITASASGATTAMVRCVVLLPSARRAVASPSWWRSERTSIWPRATAVANAAAAVSAQPA